MAKYRLGVIGFAHMHVNTLIDTFAAHPDVEWVAAADTMPSEPVRSEAQSTRTFNRRRAAEKTGIPQFFDDYHEMLHKEKFDVVICCPENSRHGEVAEAVAQAGAHIVVEKPMAATFAEALRMVRAAEDAGVSLAINWPITWSAQTRTAHRLVQEGAIGQLFQVKWRGGSLGPLKSLSNREKAAEWWHHKTDGGGVLLDYCCYGAMLSRWFTGTRAEAVTGMVANFNSHYGDADDNAVLLARFPSALCILEATWSTVDHGIPTGPIIYGNQGTIVVERRGNEGIVRLIKKSGDAGEIITSDPLPEGRNDLAREVLHHIATGEPLHPTMQIDLNLDAMAILDAGIRSADTGRTEPVPSRNWPGPGGKPGVIHATFA